MEISAEGGSNGLVVGGRESVGPIFYSDGYSWKLANTFNGRLQIDIEEKGEPSKWVTLNALRVLKRYYE